MPTVRKDSVTTGAPQRATRPCTRAKPGRAISLAIRVRRAPVCAARPSAYVAPARSMATTNSTATATGNGQPRQKSTGQSRRAGKGRPYPMRPEPVEGR